MFKDFFFSPLHPEKEAEVRQLRNDNACGQDIKSGLNITGGTLYPWLLDSSSPPLEWGMEADCAFHSKPDHHLEQSHICRRVMGGKNLLFHKSWIFPLSSPFPKWTVWIVKWLIQYETASSLFFSLWKMKGNIKLTCWRGRGSFESSHRPCLSSLTAGARWWPSRSPCWAQSSSCQRLQTATRRGVLSRDQTPSWVWLWSLPAKL